VWKQSYLPTVVFTKVDGLIDHPAGNANVDRVVFKHFQSGAILRDAAKTPVFKDEV
jgi:hypothetical protein